MTGAQVCADLTVKRAEFEVSVRFDIAAGGCLALLGPNGAGKSTVLSALAGLVPLTAGQVTLDGETVEAAAPRAATRRAAGGVRVPPERRHIALLDQRARLFPHLSIAANIAFGPRSRGMGRRRAAQEAEQWLDRIGLADRATARPHELSGGQQQRVAIARAFASRPRVLLLDEPFAALDAQSAPMVRTILSDELADTGTTAVLVTHEMSDAWQWADDCLVINRGTVVESGTPSELAVRPARAFTAALAGFAVVRGRWRDGMLVTDDAPLPGSADGELRDGDAAVGVVSPREVAVRAAGDPAASVLTSVSVQAGVVRVATGSGLCAELPAAEAITVGGGTLPRAGDRYTLVPHGMRVLADH